MKTSIHIVERKVNELRIKETLVRCKIMLYRFSEDNNDMEIKKFFRVLKVFRSLYPEIEDVKEMPGIITRDFSDENVLNTIEKFTREGKEKEIAELFELMMEE